MCLVSRKDSPILVCSEQCLGCADHFLDGVLQSRRTGVHQLPTDEAPRDTRGLVVEGSQEVAQRVKGDLALSVGDDVVSDLAHVALGYAL